MQRYVREIWQDEEGQDLIEYALMAALVATGASVMMPGAVHESLVHIYSRVVHVMSTIGNSGI
ncbi:MAG TPA: hypothetical protein VER03_08555 [Bryobacteraceae bacterium]|nr:hypothetical protein [Bryobacteraceae bacterium]